MADSRDTEAGLSATFAAGTTADALHATQLADPATLTAAPRGPPPPLRQIARFAILRELGRGAMGVVYAGYDEELDRRVAIKLVDLGDPDRASLGRNQLLREAQALARLIHPNVVAVFEAGVHDGRVYLAMEYVHGVDLEQWLAAGPRGWREVAATFLQAGAGLLAAHKVGLIHRDFKPKQSRLPPKAPLSAKRRGSPQIGAFEREAVCPGVVRSGQDGPNLAQIWPRSNFSLRGNAAVTHVHERHVQHCAQGRGADERSLTSSSEELATRENLWAGSRHAEGPSPGNPDVRCSRLPWRVVADGQ